MAEHTSGTRFIHGNDATKFLSKLDDNSIDLILTDPPYYGIVKDSWDNQWASSKEYVDWLINIFELGVKKLKHTGSLVFFGGIGKSNCRPLLELVCKLDKMLNYRNWIVWGKRRAYGKQNDYLFTREEILWYTYSDTFTFNIPYLHEKRGYAGFNKKYPAKSEYKRVTNVWTDVTELFRPKRYCQKPEPLISRLIETHSNAGDLVVDMFAGYGTIGLVSVKLGRRFAGCEAIAQDADDANARVQDLIEKLKSNKYKEAYATCRPS